MNDSRGVLLLATSNPGKILELRALLRPALPGVRLTTPEDLGLDLDVEETGSTFEENAVLKARAWARSAGMPAISDDSGLAVDALDGAPGVRSARWVAGDDRDRVRALLERLQDVPSQQRTAHFCCVAAVAVPDSGGRSPTVRTARGTVSGRIADQPRGEGGFGYDPVFLVAEPPHELRATMAELPAEAKNALSHRARAVRALMPALRDLLLDAPG